MPCGLYQVTGVLCARGLWAGLAGTGADVRGRSPACACAQRLRLRLARWLAQVHLAAAANSAAVVRLLMEAWARKALEAELGTPGEAAAADARSAGAGESLGDLRQMRTWSGLRPVDVAVTSGAVPSIVRVRSARLLLPREAAVRSAGLCPQRHSCPAI